MSLKKLCLFFVEGRFKKDDCGNLHRYIDTLSETFF